MWVVLFTETRGRGRRQVGGMSGGFEVGNLSVSRRKMAILLPGSPSEQKTLQLRASLPARPWAQDTEPCTRGGDGEASKGLQLTRWNRGARFRKVGFGHVSRLPVFSA